MKIWNIYIFYTLLIIFTLLCLYYSFFDKVILCDGNYELKDNIQRNLVNLKNACYDYETLHYTYKIQMLRIHHSGGSRGLSSINVDMLSRALERHSEANSIIRQIRRNAYFIRRTESGFKPSLELILQRYERSLNIKILG